MKLNLELDISWLQDDETIDDRIVSGVIKNIAAKVESRLSDEITKAISARAIAIVNAKTELLINTMLEKPVSVSTGWNQTTEYPSLYDMIEQKMTALYEGKYADTKSCGKDPLLVNVDSAVKAGFDAMIRDLDKKITARAAQAVRKEAEQNKLISAVTEVLGPSVPR